MTLSLLQHAVITKFTCQGPACPDTCCHGWEMPVDDRQRALYTSKAPELLDTIDPKNGVMKRSGADQACNQLCEGSCSIQTRYGEEFLSDSCYFYPRILHRIGDEYSMVGALSCPEMLRLILQTPAPFALQQAAPKRSPLARRDMVPAGWTAEAVRQVTAHAMMVAADEAHTPEAAMLALLDIAEAMETATPGNWRDRIATGSASVAIDARAGDAHAIYYALALTEAFGPPGTSLRLPQIMHQMEQALDCRFDRTTRQMTLGEGASAAIAMLTTRWQVDARSALAPVLRRWLQAQVAMTLFPFGGFAEINMAERAAVLVQRFATIRLALMCHVASTGIPPDDETVMRVIQGIARFIDHLADAKLTMMIHHDLGWNDPARLRGLVVG